MAGEKDESASGTSTTFEVNDSDFEVSDVEGEMEEQEKMVKRREKIKKKMNERLEKKAQMLFEEKMRLEKEKKIQQGYNSVSHAYETSQSSNSSNISLSTVPMGKPPPLDGTDYARWSEDMQVHLYGLNPHLWTVVCVGVPQLGEDEVATPEYEHDMFHNAQAVRVIRSSLCTMEYNKVRGIASAKEIWDTLKMSHEGNEEVKEGKIDLLQGELEAFVMKKDETVQQMHDRLTILVTDIKALGRKDWDDFKVTKEDA